MQKPYQTSRAALCDLASNMNYLTAPILSPVKDTFLKDSLTNFTPSTVSTPAALNNRIPSDKDPPTLSSSDIEQLKKIDLSYLTLFRKSSKFPNQGFNHFFLSQELDYNDHTFATESDKSSDSRRLSPARNDDASITLSTDSHALYAMAFNSDGKYLASAGADGMIRIWEVITSEHDRCSDSCQSSKNGHLNAEFLARNGSIRSNHMLSPNSYSHRKSFIDATLDDNYIKSSQGRNSVSRSRKNTINSADSIQGKNSKSNIYAPLFKQKPVKTFYHDKTVNSLDWSKNNFLLSSSEDGSVKLWHVDRADCLQTYKFESVVTCAKFHTLDDRFFLTTQWNGKLTFLSILEKEIVYEIDLKKQLTCFELSPKSDLVIIGCDKGYMFSVKIDKGFVVEADYQYKKHTPRITGIQLYGNDSNLKMLVSATDSKIRLINYSGRFLEMVYSGHTVKASSIKATTNENNSHVITGSEDGWVYFWETYSNRKDKVDRERKKRLFNKSNLNPLKFFRDDDYGIAENKAYGSFHTNQSKCNVALFAPRATLKLLELSNDPIFELKHNYSYAMQKEGIKDYEIDDLSTAVIITADSSGKIKVFRRDSSHYIRKALTSKKIGQILDSNRSSESSESIVPSLEESQLIRGRSIVNNKVSNKHAYEALVAGSGASVPTINIHGECSNTAPLGSARTITSSYPSENGTVKQPQFIDTKNHEDDTVHLAENIDEEIRKLVENSKEEQVLIPNQSFNADSIAEFDEADPSQLKKGITLKCSNCGGSDFITRPMGTGQTNQIRFYCNKCGQVSDSI